MLQKQISITLFLIVLICTYANCQTENNSIINVEGKTIVLFPNDFSFPISDISGLQKFIPSFKNLKNFETAFSSNNVKANINRCGVRQVIGYIEEGEKYLLVHLLNTRGKRELKKVFPNWQNEFAIHFGGEDERQYSVLYKYNLDKQTVHDL